MNTQNNSNNQDNVPVVNRHSMRQMRREERRETIRSRQDSPWIVGALLILLGIIFLLQNLVHFQLDNWWALFILIPAGAGFGNAWRAYQRAGGRLDGAARGSLIGGILFTMLAAVFLLGLNISILGPVLIILVGGGVLLNTILPG